MINRVDRSVKVEDNKGVINVFQGARANAPQTSIIAKVIKAFADNSGSEGDATRVVSDYGIEDKIKFNGLRSYAYLIDDYYELHAVVTERSFNVAEQERPGSTDKIFRQVNQFYKKALYSRNGRLHETRMDVIREFADDIVMDVIDEVRGMVAHDSALIHYSSEDVLLGAGCIVGYAIIECQVLEKPSVKY